MAKVVSTLDETVIIETPINFGKNTTVMPR